MSDVRAGEMFAGRYSLSTLLEEDGDSQFWRAHDHALKRDVAVHVIGSRDPLVGEVEMAAQESARLNDPRVLRVLDVTTQGVWTYVISEWASGMSLDIWLSRTGPLDPQVACWILSEVCEAVQHAHEAGVGHGALVPQHVLVDGSGQVRLIGTAIAAALQGREPGRLANDVSDIAGMLYALLSGMWPGTARTPLPPVRRVEGRFPLLSELRSDVPEIVSEICDIALNGPPATAGKRARVPWTQASEIGEALAEQVFDEPLVRQRVRAAIDANNRDEPLTGGLPAITAPLVSPPTPEPIVQPEPDLDQPTQAWQPGDLELHPSLLPDADPERPLFATEPHLPPPPPPEYSLVEPPVDVYAPVERSPRAPAPEPEPEPPPARPRRRIRLLGLLTLFFFAVALALGVWGAVWWNRGGSPAPPPSDPAASTAAAATAYDIVGVDDFDPQADPPEEFPENTPFVIDGDPTTSWQSNEYSQPFGPEGIKDGVGLVLDLGVTQDVSEVAFTLGAAPVGVQVYVLDAPPTAAPTGSPTAEGTLTSDGSLTWGTPASGRYVLVWFVESAPIDGGFLVDVAEVSVLG